jgi:hypothetical protein
MARSSLPTEIELEFADGVYLFRMGAAHIARLQDARGYEVTLPNGATYRLPKALGTIWREHTQRLGLAWDELSAPDYNPADSLEVIRQGLIGGATGWVPDKETGEKVTVDAQRLAVLMREAAALPTHTQWALALAILRTSCLGFTAAEDDEKLGEKKPGKKRKRATTSSTSPAQSQT